MTLKTLKMTKKSPKNTLFATLNPENYWNSKNTKINSCIYFKFVTLKNGILTLKNGKKKTKLTLNLIVRENPWEPVIDFPESNFWCYFSKIHVIWKKKPLGIPPKSLGKNFYPALKLAPLWPPEMPKRRQIFDVVEVLLNLWAPDCHAQKSK